MKIKLLKVISFGMISCLSNAWAMNDFSPEERSKFTKIYVETPSISDYENLNDDSIKFFYEIIATTVPEERYELLMETDKNGNSLVSLYAFYLLNLNFIDYQNKNNFKLNKFLDVKRCCYHYAYWENGKQKLIMSDLNTIYNNFISSLNSGYNGYVTILRSGKQGASAAHYYTLVISKNENNEYSLSVLNSTGANVAQSDTISAFREYFRREGFEFSVMQEFQMGSQLSNTSCGLWSCIFAYTAINANSVINQELIEIWKHNAISEASKFEAGIKNTLEQIVQTYIPHQKDDGKYSSMEESKDYKSDNEDFRVNTVDLLDHYVKMFSDNVLERGKFREYCEERFCGQENFELPLSGLSQELKIKADTYYRSMYESNK